MKITDTSGFRQLKEKRDQFKNGITLLERECETLMTSQRNMSTLITQISNSEFNKTQLDLKKYTKIKQTISVQKSTSSHNTICTVCDSNCHINCGLNETTVKGSDIFKGCAAMSGDQCTVCPHKCSYQTHVHLRVMWVKEEKETSVIDENQATLIRQLSADINNKQILLNSLQNSLQKMETSIKSKQSEISNLINQMRAICSDFNYEKEIDLSIRLLEAKIEYEQAIHNHDAVSSLSSVALYFYKLKELIFGKKI